MDDLIKTFRENAADDIEVARTLVDLFVVSVLLDAGAGDAWVFNEPNADLRMNRSEGLAVASYYMFKDGAFDLERGLKVTGMQLRLHESCYSMHPVLT